MKKTLLLVTILMTLVVFFAACNGNTPPADTSTNKTTPAATDPVGTEPVETEPVETEPPHTHTWGDWTTTLEATCTEKGVSERTCACGEKETQDIDALGHTEAIDAAVAPTCTETGLTEGYHCDACSEVFVTQETVDALGHTPGAEATCTTNQTCTVCNTELTAAK